MNILDGIPDKRIDKNTTSLKFKKDIIDYFSNIDTTGYRCIEVGTNKGYTTRVLSLVFDHVVTLELRSDLIKYARETNKDRTNIEYVQCDVYNSEWGVVEDHQIAFIDCDHRYSYVRRDIENCLKLNVKYIIFDDYGLPENKPCVKVAVDTYIEEVNPNSIKYIGEPAGNEPRVGRPLVDWEGVIIEI
jgi:hypothetical protein